MIGIPYIINRDATLLHLLLPPPSVIVIHYSDKGGWVVSPFRLSIFRYYRE